MHEQNGNVFTNMYIQKSHNKSKQMFAKHKNNTGILPPFVFRVW